jgi:very-short-patch-repair endonuclease
VHDSHALLRTGGDLAVAAHAERQSGVVSTAQLHAAGLGRGAIQWRVQRGRLHPYHRGVYAVGHRRLTFRGRLWAAILACGGPEVAVISHRSAAAVWDLLPAPAGKIDVMTLGRSESTKALRVHRSRTILPLNDVVLQHPDGLPLTTPTRTLHDLARTLTPHKLERLTQRAEHLRLIPRATPELQITRSELEERMLALIADHGLPQPRTNTMVNGHEVDFHWPHARLIVETDGAATHLTAAAFEADRRRDVALLLAGYRVVRFTYRQVVEEPERVAAILRALL